ncbi:hypothetical protein LLG96_10905 [bacterium]|nr:hypothetical protein [bacterium]
MMFTALSAYSQPYAVSDSKGKSVFQLPLKPNLSLKKLSLLDPERFTMKQQYSMNFSSVGGNGTMMGMYLNTMEYRFNMPLTMRLRVAYQSQNAQLFGDKNYSGYNDLNGGRVYIPSFDLVYKPFKNTVIGFFYRDYSSMNNPYSYNSPYGYGYDRFGYSPYMGF